MDSATMLMWQGFGAPALELAVVEPGTDALAARGAAIRSAPEPYHLAYRLETTAGWVTASLTVESWGPGWSRSLELRREDDGSWWADPGGRLPELDGALDCDLGLCCLTNTMPVLRHRLHARGGSVDLRVAWVSVPDLAVHVQRQRYTHLARAGRGAVVRYESGTYAASVEFDEDGLVVDYPGLARRIR